MMAFDTKNPSAATNKGRIVSKAYNKHRLPQARCPVGSLFFRLPAAAEGRFESYFANSPIRLAIGWPRVKWHKVF